MTDTLEQVGSDRLRRTNFSFDLRSGRARSTFDRRSDPEAGQIAFQSGLPLRLAGGEPAEPGWSGATIVQLRLKRVLLDMPLTLLALVALAPLLLAVVALIKLTSRGPVLFRQSRVGLNGDEFEILKFRTMFVEDCDDTGSRQATTDDGRVTGLGRLLRATSIDELPQLWNVLRGDMSLVGPRPMVRGQLAGGVPYHEAVPYYGYRFRVRPGLSGWAQANGLRGSTADLAAARQRIDHDCAYVQNYSLLLDLRIIFKTIVREFIAGTGR